ncbi:MAG: hypothetical protein ACNA8W_11280, partial [Bradymonadaceae bacterium]
MPTQIPMNTTLQNNSLGSFLYSLRTVGVLLLVTLWMGAGCLGCNDKGNQEIDCEGAECDTVLCDSSLSCAEDQVCLGGQCANACAADADCTEDEICSRNRYCIPRVDVTACVFDADCPSRRCDDGTCTPARRCEEDASCFDGEFCSLDGYCVPECQGAVQCDSGEVCHDGRCIIGGSCSDDAECGAGGSCDDGSCHIACHNDDECGRDATCFEGQCQAGCSADVECPGGLCWRGTCVPASPTDPTRPMPEIPAEEPVDNNDAPDAGIDIGEDTGPPVSQEPSPDRDDAAQCTANADCPSSTERCEDGLCVETAICQSNTDCSEGSTCQRGRCRLGCDDTSQCRTGETCTDGQCLTPQSDDLCCRSTDDCSPCEVCVSGACQVVQQFCVTNAQCGIGKSCLSGLCHYECAADSDCPTSHTCQS